MYYIASEPIIIGKVDAAPTISPTLLEGDQEPRQVNRPSYAHEDRDYWLEQKVAVLFSVLHAHAA